MKTIYSILSIPINAALDEKISIGVVMTDGNNFYFKYSIDKLNAIKGILSPTKQSLLKTYLRSLEKDVNSNDSTVLFKEHFSYSSKWANSTYLTYLSRYSNNIIQFSPSKNIDLPNTEKTFKWLFEKYVFKFEEIEEEPKPTDIISKVKKCLYPAIEDNVNIDITLDSTNFENLFVPIQVNFLGHNDVAVAGQTFNFEKPHHFLENDVSRYVSLTKALEMEGKENAKYFVLGREPKKSNEKGHHLWEHIRDSDFLEFIDIDEYGIVEEYIKKHEVKPYFETE